MTPNRTNKPSRRGRLLRSILVALVATSLAATPALAADDPRSTYAGERLSVDQVMQLAYDAGLRTETALLSATSVAVAESSLWTRTRNWHPEHGYRPAGDPIGVPGPPAAWNASETRQLHADRGLWQISSYWWPGFTDAEADDPAEAARIVMALSEGGTDFTLWDTFASGSAQRTWDAPYDGWPALRPLVREFLATRGPTPTPTPPTGPRTHTVVDGDTLFRLAARFYGDGHQWVRIAAANGINRRASIDVGETLLIP